MISNISQIFKQLGLITLLYAIMMYTNTYSINVYLVSLFSILSFIVLPIKKYVDKPAIFLFLFSIAYTIISFANGIVESYVQYSCHLLSPVIFYCFGRYTVKKLNNKDIIIAFILITFLLFTLDTFIEIFKSISINGIVNTGRNIALNGESHEKSATLLGLILSVNLAGIGIFINDKNRYKSLVSYIFLILCIFSLICNMHMINRTGIVICVIVIVLTTLYANKKKVFKIVFALSILSAVIWLLFEYNIISDDIIQAYESRKEYDEMNDRGFTSERDISWVYSIKQLFIHPTGWADIKSKFNPYAHNMWLDTARDAGILPFISLIIFTIYSTRNFIYIYKQKADYYNIVLYSIYIIFFISLFMEPIFQGVPLYAYIFFMICGIMKQINVQNDLLHKSYARI